MEERFENEQLKEQYYNDNSVEGFAYNNEILEMAQIEDFGPKTQGVEVPYVEIKTKVYIEINENNEIIKIFSSDFEEPKKESLFIDEGIGDKYRHAQSQYFDKPLINEDGHYNYKYVGKKIIENKG